MVLECFSINRKTNQLKSVCKRRPCLFLFTSKLGQFQTNSLVRFSRLVGKSMEFFSDLKHVWKLLKLSESKQGLLRWAFKNYLSTMSVFIKVPFWRIRMWHSSWVPSYNKEICSRRHTCFSVPLNLLRVKQGFNKAIHTFMTLHLSFIVKTEDWRSNKPIGRRRKQDE